MEGEDEIQKIEVEIRRMALVGHRTHQKYLEFRNINLALAKRLSVTYIVTSKNRKVATAYPVYS